MTKQNEMLKKIFTILAVIIGLTGANLNALDISVTAFNRSSNSPLTLAEKVTILKLSATMEEVSVKTDTALPVSFKNLPPMDGAPYMVQVKYQGVNYNKVIPPVQQGNVIPVKVEVFNSTNQYGAWLKMEKFVEIHYYNHVLATDITLHFINSGNVTYTARAGRNGILVKIPVDGKMDQAMATIESANENSSIKTVKVNPLPLPDKPGYYLLDQPIKPGEKYYTFRVLYRYTGSPLQIPFESIYPMSSNFSVVLHPKKMKVKWQENPSWDMSAKFNEQLDVSVISLPKSSKYTLVFSKGEPEQSGASGNTGNAGNNSGGSVLPTSPLTFYWKIGGAGMFIILGIAFFYYLKRRPVWLQMIQSKTKSRLEFELEHLKKMDIDPQAKEKRSEKIRLKLASLEKISKL